MAHKIIQTIIPLAPLHRGTTSYLSSVEKLHPGYIHRIFHYAQQIIGVLASFSDLSTIMNQKSSTEPTPYPTTSISRIQLNTWFVQQGGKETASTTKPLDTPDHICKRMVWVSRWFDKMRR